jgi:hypothetical protein
MKLSPFSCTCGSAPAAKRYGEAKYEVVCRHCGKCGPTRKTEAAAVKAWNGMLKGAAE